MCNWDFITDEKKAQTPGASTWGRPTKLSLYKNFLYDTRSRQGEGGTLLGATLLIPHRLVACQDPTNAYCEASPWGL